MKETGIIKWYRVERWFYLHHMTPVAMVIKGIIRILWGGVIPYQTAIGRGTMITYHGLGVVLNKKAIIGENPANCTAVGIPAKPVKFNAE